MSKNNWHKGYQEVKNVIHNDIGVTKEEILEVFRQVAKDEIKEIISDNQKFIWNVLSDIIQSEMIKAVEDHRYPEINGNTIFYRGSNGRGIDSFKDYVAGVMKEEVLKSMKEQFSVNVDIEKKY